MGVEAYRRVQKIAEGPRAEEYRRLAELTLALVRAEKSRNMALRAKAVTDNQRFWSSLRLSMLSAQHSLPAGLRGQFVTLADWMERESVLASLGQAEFEDMIAVNLKIMEGLRPYQGSVKDDTLEIRP